MLFGVKKDFAIEAMVEPDLAPPSHPWGRLRVWISDIGIGDFDDPHCGLAPAYDGFKQVVDEISSLWLEELEGLSDVEIWNFFDGPLYGHHGEEEIDFDSMYSNDINYWHLYGKFSFLTNWGEMFDQDPRGKAFIIKDQNDRLKILTRPNYSKVEPLYCSVFSFRKAVKDFCEWFIGQEQRLKGENA